MEAIMLNPRTKGIPMSFMAFCLIVGAAACFFNVALIARYGGQS